MSASGEDTNLPPTLLAGLLSNAQRRPSSVAWRIKRRGAWRETSWADAVQDVARAADAFTGLGVVPGESIAIVGDWQPEVLVLDLAAQAVGSRPVAVSALLGSDELIRVIADARPRIVVCGDGDVVRDLAVRRDELTGVEVVFAVNRTRTDKSAIDESARALVVDFEDLLTETTIEPARSAAQLQQLAERRTPGDVAFVGFSPGTSGQPKTFEFLEASVVGAALGMIATTGMTAKDRVVCYFPLSHPLGRILGGYAALVCGASLNVLYSRETVIDDLIEVGPTVLLASPRLPVALRALHDRRMRYAKGSLTRLGTRSLRRLTQEEAVPTRVGRGGDSRPGRLAARRVRAQLGLRELKWFGCLGPVSPRLDAFYRSLGVPLVEAYALTEAGGLVCHRSAGRAALSPCAGVQLRVERRDGQLSMMPPWPPPRQLEAGDRPSTDWVQTDDVGENDADGGVRILGRRREVLHRGGQIVSLGVIERAIAETPFVRTAIGTPTEDAGVTLLLELDVERVSEWTQGQAHIRISNAAQISQHPDVMRMIEERVRSAVAVLDPTVELKRLVFLPRELSIERMELTTTGSVRREIVHAAFGTRAQSEPITSGALGA